MSDQQSNQTGFGSTFSGQGGNAQTNPFTADLKGEFSSNFGTNTNAVSQIFKEGGFASQRPTKLIIAGVVVVLIAVGLGIYLMRDTSSTDEALPFDETAETKDEATEEKPAEDAAKTEEQAAAPAEGAPAEGTAAANDAAPAQEAAPAQQATGSGTISMITPNDGQAWTYDETKGGAPFKWEGGGAIIISRSSNMSPEYMRVTSERGSFTFKNPYPGTWYWQVENADGKSEVRSFSVASPSRRNVTVTAPAAGGSLSEGAVVSWQGDDKVAFYRVEFSNSNSFANPSYRFATSGNSVQITGVTAGQYQMRVAAFSEVSGRWEYSSPMTVTVQ